MRLNQSAWCVWTLKGVRLPTIPRVLTGDGKVRGFRLSSVVALGSTHALQE